MILEYPLIAQAKLDGIRGQIHVHEDGGIQIFSRSLKEKTNSFPDIVCQIFESNLPAGIYDSEIFGINSDGSPMKFNQFQKRINTEKDVYELTLEYPCIIKIFDVLYYDNQDVTGFTQVERRKLIEQFSDLILDEVIVNNREDIIKYHKECIKAGHEGIVLKRPDGLYFPGQGKESFKNFFKYKPTELRFDVVITGATFGTGDNLDVLSSFNIAVLDTDHMIRDTFVDSPEYALKSVGKCGIGFDRATLELLTERIMKASNNELENYICLDDPIVIEVNPQEITRNESGGIGLRFPVFEGIREDKNLEDIDKVSMISQYIE